MEREPGQAEVWDLLICTDCNHQWASPDVDETWNPDPENCTTPCPNCESCNIVREERG